TGVYPQVWTEFTATISGLGAPTTGRIAFRYFVTSGGPQGANSSYIGIDDARYCAAAGATPTATVATPTTPTATVATPTAVTPTVTSTTPTVVVPETKLYLPLILR
ncbi:MAG: choice-of-anchor J domain-containing protein, partial [Herpetosiphonaceae bacterium]|nr:choice-of-anchor J domain-containing protein [Herpetosiphonaceae bacterium]